MVKFGVIGDIEGAKIVSSDINNFIKDMSFLVHTGDCVGKTQSKEDTIQQIERLMNVFSDVGLDIEQLIGNHDLDNLTTKEFLNIIGLKNESYSYDVKGIHFIFLNSADGSMRGNVNNKNFYWLKKDLKKTTKPTVVFTHHLIGTYPRQRILENPNTSLISNHKDVRQLLEDSGKVVLVVEGHAHYRHYKHHNIDYVCVGHRRTHNSIWNFDVNTERILAIEKGVNGRIYNYLNIPRNRDKSYYASVSADMIVSKVSGGNVLNVGCVSHTIRELKWQRETGEWLHDRLLSVADYVEGIDISSNGIAYMQALGYTAVYMNAEEIETDKKFDYVVAGFVIDHLSNIGKFFEGCQKVCKKDGTIIITQKNPYAFVYIKRVLKQGKWADDNIGLFTPELLNNLAARYGFKCINIEYAKPREFGISKILYWLGAKQFGGHTYLVQYKEEKNND